MEITLERIREGYQKLIDSDDFINYSRNKMLADGKSKEVFLKNVIARVNLQYMGLVDNRGLVPTYSREEGKFSMSYNTKFSDLVVGDNILKSVTQIYSELAADKKPLLSVENDFTKTLDLKKDIAHIIREITFGGSVCMKGTYEDEIISYYPVRRTNFFTINNQVQRSLVDAIVVFWYEKNKEKELIHCEIYTEGKTEYKDYSINNNKIEAEVGNREDDNTYEGWQVSIIDDISDFDEDVVSNVRELIIGDTLASQSLDKVANPLISMDESAVEYDENGKGKVDLKNRILLLERDARKTEQITLETKIADWIIQRKIILNKIYTSLAINDNVLGISETSMGESSGEAIKKSYQRTISRVNTKRNKVYTALEVVLNWGYSYAGKGTLDIEIKGKDIIELSESEMLANQKVKIENLNALATIENETMIAKVIQDQKDELLKDIIGG